MNNQCSQNAIAMYAIVVQLIVTMTSLRVKISKLGLFKEQYSQSTGHPPHHLAQGTTATNSSFMSSQMIE
ncbi:hypothetical protein chiPu_0015534 [Chiloscyllium punctatum]|uniref:Uncharacterized protein n=1 Tax=Chiloscyllium punctatum TaxID=137246 RepID=A0A401T344_CHIPU|nr:hypothetical protein [Chiloscyllium punctatum]